MSMLNPENEPMYELSRSNQMFSRLTGEGYPQRGGSVIGNMDGTFLDSTTSFLSRAAIWGTAGDVNELDDRMVCWGYDDGMSTAYSSDVSTSSSVNGMIQQSTDWGASGGQSSGTHDFGGQDFHDGFRRGGFF